MFNYAFGLGCNISWFWLFYLQGPLLAPVCRLWSVSAESIFLCFFVSMVLTFLLLAQVIKIRSLRNKKIALTICGFILSLAPLLTAILPRFGVEVAYPYIIYLLAVSSGIAQAVFFTVWMETTSACDFRQSCIITSLAFLLGGSTASLSQLADYLWLLPALTLLPLISLLCLLYPQPSTFTFPRDFPRSDIIRLFPVKLIISLGLIYLNGGILVRILNWEQACPNMFYWSYLAYVFFCPAIGLLLYNNENIDLRFIYRLLLPIMSIGFLLFWFENRLLWFAAFAILQSGSALLNLYAWLLFPYFARFSCRPAAVCAYGNFIILLCVIGGNIITEFLATVLFNSSSIKELTFIACIVSAVLIFLFPSEKESFAGWQAVFAPKSPAPNDLLVSADTAVTSDYPEIPSDFDKYALSQREKEVLMLLIKGRNGRFISEELNISVNTVKTHVRNIYGKLAVNDRQQLLSMFDNSATNT